MDLIECRHIQGIDGTTITDQECGFAPDVLYYITILKFGQLCGELAPFTIFNSFDILENF